MCLPLLERPWSSLWLKFRIPFFVSYNIIDCIYFLIYISTHPSLVSESQEVLLFFLFIVSFYLLTPSQISYFPLYLLPSIVSNVRSVIFLYDQGDSNGMFSRRFCWGRSIRSFRNIHILTVQTTLKGDLDAQLVMPEEGQAVPICCSSIGLLVCDVFVFLAILLMGITENNYISH